MTSQHPRGCLRLPELENEGSGKDRWRTLKLFLTQGSNGTIPSLRNLNVPENWTNSPRGHGHTELWQPNQRQKLWDNSSCGDWTPKGHLHPGQNKADKSSSYGGSTPNGHLRLDQNKADNSRSYGGWTPNGHLRLDQSKMDNSSRGGRIPNEHLHLEQSKTDNSSHGGWTPNWHLYLEQSKTDNSSHGGWTPNGHLYLDQSQDLSDTSSSYGGWTQNGQMPLHQSQDILDTNSISRGLQQMYQRLKSELDRHLPERRIQGMPEAPSHPDDMQPLQASGRVLYGSLTGNPANTSKRKIRGARLFQLPPCDWLSSMMAVGDFGGPGRAEGLFNEVNGIAAFGINQVAIADTNNSRIQIFKNGHYVSGFETRDRAQFWYPNRIVYNKGRFVVSFRKPVPHVKVYSQYGEIVSSFGAVQLRFPRGLAVDEQGNVIVLENMVQRVHIFTPVTETTYKKTSSFGCQRGFPIDVAVRGGEIFVCDNLNHNVQVYTYQGVLQRTIGGVGRADHPVKVIVSHRRHLMVVSNHDCFHVTVYTQDGEYLTTYRSDKKHEDCLDVAFVDRTGTFTVACADDKVYRYRIHVERSM